MPAAQRVKTLAQELTDMTHIETGGRPHLQCGQCQTVVVWPKGLATEEKAAIAAAARRDAVAGARMVGSRYGFDERQARALVVHLTQIPGSCHRCESQLQGGELLCPKCYAANLNW
jgi:cell division inhibitor SulA